MNNNHPFFKQAQKIAKRFNTKPMFLDYDEISKKPFFRPYKKYKDDVLDLIFIKGIPIISAYRLYGNKGVNVHTKIDNLFYNKFFKMYSLIDLDGIVRFILYIEDNTIFVKKVVPIGDYEIYGAYTKSNIIDVANKVKQENKDMFYF